jgi:hypothetical protein
VEAEVTRFEIHQVTLTELGWPAFSHEGNTLLPAGHYRCERIEAEWRRGGLHGLRWTLVRAYLSCLGLDQDALTIPYRLDYSPDYFRDERLSGLPYIDEVLSHHAPKDA